jgi:hypothetical protein
MRQDIITMVIASKAALRCVTAMGAAQSFNIDQFSVGSTPEFLL